MRKPLTNLQASFVQNYIENGFNAPQAAISAGYSHLTATTRTHDITNSPAVKAQLLKAYAKAEQKIVVTFQKRIESLERIIDDILPSDPDKKPRRMLYGLAIRAITELNKMHGDYAPQKLLRLNVDCTKEKLDEAKRVYEDY
jgi:phage terminase small subunit